MIRSPRRRLLILAVLSVGLFFVPILAPLVQAVTFAEALRLGWRGSADRTSVALATLAAAAGFLLFFATEYLWLV